jgi:hypothetical protein
VLSQPAAAEETASASSASRSSSEVAAKVSRLVSRLLGVPREGRERKGGVRTEQEKERKTHLLPRPRSWRGSAEGLEGAMLGGAIGMLVG